MAVLEIFKSVAAMTVMFCPSSIIDTHGLARTYIASFNMHDYRSASLLYIKSDGSIGRLLSSALDEINNAQVLDI